MQVQILSPIPFNIKKEEVKDKIVEEVLKLYYSGYDGPMMGKEIEPLYKAIIEYEKINKEVNGH